MGTSTDGQICYGVLLEEGFEFPWSGYGTDEEDYYSWCDEDELTDWWLQEINACLGGYSYEEKKFLLSKFPLPVTMVNVCSGDYPIYIAACPEPILSASRGVPVEIGSLDVDPRAIRRLIDFCYFQLELVDFQPKLWLSSYWG